MLGDKGPSTPRHHEEPGCSGRASTTLPTLASILRTALSCQGHPESPMSQSKSEAAPCLELCLWSLHTHLFLCEALEGRVPSGLRASELPLVEKAWHLLIRPQGRLSKMPCEQPEIAVYPERPAFTPNAGEAGEVAAPCPSRGDMPPD